VEFTYFGYHGPSASMATPMVVVGAISRYLDLLGKSLILRVGLKWT